MIQKSTLGLFAVAGLVVIGLVGLAVYKNVAPSPYDAFAQCLSDEGVTMYGAWWCPHCQNQKELFGNAFRNINYVECSAPGSRSMLPICSSAGITGYPTWRFADGSELNGEAPLASLAEKTTCQLPTIE